MKTNIIRTGTFKAMAGLALAAAISSEPTRAADQAAWDKTFRKSEKVEHRKVTFKNRYGITLSADPVSAENSQRQTGGDCPQWPLWRGEGAILWLVCANYGGTRLRHPGL